MDDPLLFVVSFPELAASDQIWVESHREGHDPNASLLGAHFTLAFALQNVSEADLIKHLHAIAAQARQIPFTIRHACVGHDHAKARFHGFLVPDEGSSCITLLRRTLHTGCLEGHLHPEIPFQPHITIATSDDAHRMQALCDDVNRELRPISGVLSELHLVRHSQRGVETVEAFKLSAEHV